MKKYYSPIFSLMLVLFAAWLSIHTYDLMVTKERVSRFEKVQSRKSRADVSVVPVNEGIYLSLQERNTSLILTCFAVGFGLFGFLTFKGVSDLFDVKVMDVKRDYEAAAKNYNSHIGRMNHLEKDLCMHTATIFSLDAEKFLDKEDEAEYARSMFVALEKYCQVLSIGDLDKGFEAYIKGLISSNLKKVLRNINDFEGLITLDNVTVETFNERVNTISKQIGKEDIHLLHSLAAKFRMQ